MPRDDGPLGNFAEAIANGKPVDWDLPLKEGALTAEEVAAFKAIALMQRIQDVSGTSDRENTSWDGFDVELGFEFEEELGRGANSRVFRAHDKALGRDVAVKVLRNDLSLSPLQQRRFLKEAQTLASLDHPNIVRILSIDRSESTLRLCLERIDGRTLDEVVAEDGVFSPEEAARIAADLCRALTVLHAKGVVHRDLKPSNIMITNTGRVVLLDFGLVHSIGPADFRKLRGMSGTPLVMAPEQFTPGSDLGPAVDIYALGVLLYWMVTGDFPFEAADFGALRDQVFSGGAVPLANRQTRVPARFTRIVEKAMAVRPEDRFRSAEAFGENLDLIGREAKNQKRRRFLLGSVILVALILVGLGSTMNLLDPGSVVETVSIMKTIGSKIVFSMVRKGEPNSGIYSINPDGTGLVALTAGYTKNACSPCISPDGTRIAFLGYESDRAELWWMYADGSSRNQVSRHESGNNLFCVSWYDNETLAYIHMSQGGVASIRTVALDGGSETILVNFPFVVEDPSPSLYNFSPDHKYLAVAAQTGSWSPSTDLYLVDMESGPEPGRVRKFYADATNDHNDMRPFWSADGQRIYWSHLETAGKSTTDAIVVSKAVSPAGEPDRFDSILRPAGRILSLLQSLSPDGDSLLLAACGDGVSCLQVRDLSTGGEKEIFTVEGSIDTADWGIVRAEKIVYAPTIEQGGESEIYTINPNHSHRQSLTGDLRGDAHHPLIAPDSARIAFTVDSAGTSTVWTMDCDGNGKERLVARSGLTARAALAWLDKETLIVTAIGADGRLIVAWGLNGGTRPLTAASLPAGWEVTEAAGDPTGSRLACAIRSTKTEECGIYLLEMATGKFEPFFLQFSEPADCRNPTWGADGETLYWSIRRGSSPDWSAFDVVCKATDSIATVDSYDRLVRSADGNSAWPCDVSPDGSLLLLMRCVHDSAVELITHDLATGNEEALHTALYALRGADWGILCK